MGFTERERQTSEDILEELRTQGIIKTASGTSQTRQREDTLLTPTGRPPQKPPAKLEKLEIKRKKENNLTVEDIESKTREEKLKQELLTDIPSLIIEHESRTTRSEIDSATSGVSSSFQLSSLNLDPRSLMQEEEVDECYSFKDFDVVESDLTYNTINETF
ncbi:stathmin domain-containing protein 1 [Eublepharis macularius]|uniref:Stathmin domain-containing protein 1 n=1 Tax=Eublepharis macularius TaxID=481883 RepID=A0AA97L6K3_EUBMA|nr:stathmin domain-containing protein 1 [Eublepharis macularius]